MVDSNFWRYIPIFAILKGHASHVLPSAENIESEQTMSYRDVEYISIHSITDPLMYLQTLSMSY